MMNSRNLLVILLLFIQLPQLTSQTAPSVTQAYNLGIIENEPFCNAVIPIQNSTEIPFTVLSVRTHCACIKAELEVWSLMPGDVSFLNLRVDLTTKKGSFREIVDVYTDLPTHGIIRFYLEGYVVSPIELSPSLIEFEIGNGKTTKNIVVKLESTNKPLTDARIIKAPEWLAHKNILVNNAPSLLYYGEESRFNKNFRLPPDNLSSQVHFIFNIIENNLEKKQSGNERIFFETEPPSNQPVYLTINWARK
jgi:hypothetical protein